MLLQSLLRPVLTPIMRGIFDPAQSVSAAWSPLALWPDGIASPGMWNSPSTLAASWADYTGTTPVAVPGTVADSANPVGLALDIRAGATVLADPGNHMLQSTSSARPLLSARVNLLQYTEDFTNGYWSNATATVTPNYGTAPDGTQTSTRLQFAGANLAILKANILSSDEPSTASCWIKGPVGETFMLEASLATTNLVTLTGAWQRATCPRAAGQSFVIGTYGGATARDIEVWHPQFELGLDATDYQAVLGNGSTYATGFPTYQKYDGTDDGMATAAFAAGTLINGMDCMIPVRRNVDLRMIIGLYKDALGSGWFGLSDATIPAPCYDSCGTPTVWVDNVQLAGGTSVNRDTLAASLTVGVWKILEFRGLDLSAWTAVQYGSYGGGFQVVGDRGDILLYPSTASTTDKDAARQYLADYYGVTLP
jgi:hypothetical protein